MAQNTFGYPDFRRQDDYDGPVEWNLPAANRAGSSVSPVMDVSKFSHLGGTCQEGATQTNLVFRWYADPALTILVGAREIVLSSLLPFAHLHIPNQGPYLQITAGYSGIAQFQIVAFPTNRVHILELIPESAYFSFLQNNNIAAGSTAFYPQDYFTGPMLVWLSTPGGPVFVTLQALNPAGNWDDTGQTLVATNAALTTLLLAPPGAWRFVVQNSGALTTGFLVATPSFTGST